MSTTKPMYSEYVKLSQTDDLINPHGVCIVCGKSGLHIECEKIFSEEDIELKKKFGETKRIAALDESNFLERNSIIKDYGFSCEKSSKEFQDIKKSIIRKFGDIHAFDQTRIIENNDWWYVPYFFVGLSGYIYERNSLKIIPLESAYGGHIDALKLYVSGKLK